MELSPSLEAASCAATQEFLKILLNPKVHYRVQKSPPRHPISLRPILILSSHLHLSLPSIVFPSDFPTKILHAFFLRSKTVLLKI
jgi:hypothetical protein